MKTSIFGRTIYTASVTDVGCGGLKEGSGYTAEFKIIQDARLSFMSGHSSGTTYAMVFAVIYIHSRLKTRSGRSKERGERGKNETIGEKEGE